MSISSSIGPSMESEDAEKKKLAAEKRRENEKARSARNREAKREAKRLANENAGQGEDKKLVTKKKKKKSESSVGGASQGGANNVNVNNTSNTSNANNNANNSDTSSKLKGTPRGKVRHLRKATSAPPTPKRLFSSKQRRLSEFKERGGRIKRLQKKLRLSTESPQAERIEDKDATPAGRPRGDQVRANSKGKEEESSEGSESPESPEQVRPNSKGKEEESSESPDVSVAPVAPAPVVPVVPSIGDYVMVTTKISSRVGCVLQRSRRTGLFVVQDAYTNAIFVPKRSVISVLSIPRREFIAPPTVTSLVPVQLAVALGPNDHPKFDNVGLGRFAFPLERITADGVSVYLTYETDAKDGTVPKKIDSASIFVRSEEELFMLDGSSADTHDRVLVKQGKLWYVATVLNVEEVVTVQYGEDVKKSIARANKIPREEAVVCKK